MRHQAHTAGPVFNQSQFQGVSAYVNSQAYSAHGAGLPYDGSVSHHAKSTYFMLIGRLSSNDGIVSLDSVPL